MYKVTVKILKEKKVYLVPTKEAHVAENTVFKELDGQNIHIEFTKIEKVEYDNIFEARLANAYFDLKSEYTAPDGSVEKLKILYNHTSLIAAITDYEESKGRTIVSGSKNEIISILNID